MSIDSLRFPVLATPRCGWLAWIEGAGNRVRTDDLLITNQLLYQLSYAGNDARSVAQRAGPDKHPYERERTSTVSGSAVSRFFITVLR